MICQEFQTYCKKKAFQLFERLFYVCFYYDERSTFEFFNKDIRKENNSLSVWVFAKQ